MHHTSELIYHMFTLDSWHSFSDKGHPLCCRIQDGQANYVACHNESYVEANKFDVVRFIKRGGTFFLNTRIASLDPDKRIKALEEKLSPKILRTL